MSAMMRDVTESWESRTARWTSETDLVYAAESDAYEEWISFYYWEMPDDDRVDLDRAVEIVGRLWSGYGFSGEPPPVKLGIPSGAGEELAGCYRDGVIYLDSSLQPTRWTVVHETAHAMRPNAGHGEQFRAVMVSLIHREYDADASDLLRQWYKLADLDLDESWLDLGA